MFRCTVIIAVCISAGCRTSTMGGVLAEKARGGGSAHVYPINSEQAWQIAVDVFRWEGSAAIEEHRDGSFMLTTFYDRQVGMSYAGVWVEPAPSGTKVTCAVDGLSFSEGRFHARFAQALVFVQRGLSVPLEAPAVPAKVLLP